MKGHPRFDPLVILVCVEVGEGIGGFLQLDGEGHNSEVGRIGRNVSAQRLNQHSFEPNWGLCGHEPLEWVQTIVPSVAPP
jgi:hypothetical protein